MNYIILDMEWNQSYPKLGEDNRKRKTKNEIIEIGAIKLDENMNCLASYKRLIRPVFIRKLNSHVKKLTGITEKMLAEGSFFPETIEEFRKWCGEDRKIITWGYDDIPMLISCLKMYGMDSGWIGDWYNLQLIFNAQTDSGTNQKSLKSALEHFNSEIDEEHPWHDALNDAYYTAVICRKLDLKKGIEDYNSCLKSKKSEVLAEGDSLKLKEIFRQQFRGIVIDGRRQYPEAFNNNPCPVCHAPMVRCAWLKTGTCCLATIAECKRHGKFFLRINICRNKRGEKSARKIIYDITPEAERYYAKVQKKWDDIQKVKENKRKSITE